MFVFHANPPFRDYRILWRWCCGVNKIKKQTERFIQAAKEDSFGIVFWFALAIGARPGEYLALQWPDVSLHNCEVKISKSIWWPKKGGWKVENVKTQASLRTINFSAIIARALNDHRRDQLARRLRLGKKYENHDLIFASGTGPPLRIRSLTRHLGQIVKKTKIEGAHKPLPPQAFVRNLGSSIRS